MQRLPPTLRFADSVARGFWLQRTNAQFRGSSKYASVNTHQNEDQGRRDDLWSMFYLLVEVLDGELPWTEVRDHGSDRTARDIAYDARSCARAHYRRPRRTRTLCCA